MKNENAPAVLPAPEAQEINKNQIERAFAEAQQGLFDLPGQKGFILHCKEQNVDPEAFETPEYWNTVGSFISEKAAILRKKPGYIDNQRVDALELLANTPSFLFSKYKLDHSKPDAGLSEDALITAKYDGLVQQFTHRYPDAPVSTVTRGLLTMASRTVEDKNVLASAQVSIHKKTLGVQYENFGEQMLRKITDNSDRYFRRSTPAEDVRGIDYLVMERNKPAIRIDFKANSEQLDGHDFRKEGGILIVGPLDHPGKFHDRFFMPEDVVDEHAPQLEAYLDISQKSPAALAQLALEHA